MVGVERSEKKPLLDELSGMSHSGGVSSRLLEGQWNPATSFLYHVVSTDPCFNGPGFAIC